MNAVHERLTATSEWGIDPVPARLRILSGFDLAILWGDLGIGLLVLVAGGLLVPGLGFAAATVTILVGSLVGVALLSFVGAVGARHGVPTMVLLRPVLGIRGSWVGSLLNGLQLIGWTAVELWAMSYVADIVAQRTFGVSVRPLWLVLSAVACMVLALWGPVGVTRIWMERFGAWVIGLISVVLTALVLSTKGISEALSSTGTGALTFGPALDLVIALPASWAPLVADYTRFAARSGSAWRGTFSGFFIANVWLYALGALLVSTTATDPSPAGMAGGILALAGGSIAGVLFLTGLLVGETDEAFADIYSAAVCVENIAPRIPRRATIVVISLVSTALAASFTMERYEAFLFLLGSIFIPLFGVFAAHPFARSQRPLDLGALYETGGPYWFTRGFRLAAFAPWLAGLAVYHWILPTGPSWWIEAVERVVGEPLASRFGWLSASIPAFLTSFVLALLISRRARESDAAVYHPQDSRPRGGS